MRIYLIKNTINNKVYIGQTTSTLKKRFGDHIKNLRNGTHGSPHLQNAWDKYGEDCWKIELLTECDSINHMNEMEIFFIKKYNSTDRTVGYNVRKGGDGGGPHSEETKEKLRSITLSQWERDRDKLNAIRKSQWTEEHRENMRQIMQEKWKDKKYVAKQMSTRRSEEVRGKLRVAAQKNRHKRSHEVKERWQDPEYKARVSQSIKNSNTEEVKKKRADSIKKAFSDPEVKLRWLERMKEVRSDPEVIDKMSKANSKYFGRVEGPNGNIYEVVGIRRFCREHNLQYSPFRGLKYNPNKTYKGWKYIHENNN
jgi:group I intron endonuclease